MHLALSTAVTALAALISTVVSAETHLVRLNNLCPSGTPQLVRNGVILSGNGTQSLETITIFGSLNSTIAYLQTGECLLNGENCTLVETALENLSDSGSVGSLTDITLSPPHKFNVAVSASYFNGCDGLVTSCTSPDCTFLAILCKVDNVGLEITFCPESTVT